ncbi:MAG TPA: M20/M25/M40 family metallo-hydrolase [Coriobacteriia bacterium]
MSTRAPGSPKRGETPVDPDDRLLATFLGLVRIDSPSGEEEAVARHLVDELRGIGLKVRVDDCGYDADSNTGNVIGELAGTAPGRTVVLAAHMDTVEPGRRIEPVVEDGIVRSAGNTILGADDKAGIAAILEALRRLVASGRPYPCVRVLFTVGEERGLQGAKALDQQDAAGDLCLVLDADGAPGGIVTVAPTHYTFTATFHGHAAHAGVEPEKGRSAIAMAARAIASMRLGRLDEATTANIGHINGGGATNVVAANCHVTGECRSADRARVEEVRSEMDAALRAAAKGAGGSVTVLWTKEYDGFAFRDDDPLLHMVEEAIRDAGLRPRRFATGGGSDGNVLAAKGLPSLVLATGMTAVHGTSESLAVGHLNSLVRLLLAVIARATG